MMNKFKLLSCFKAAAVATVGGFMIYDIATTEPPKKSSEPIVTKTDSNVTLAQREQMLNRHPGFAEALNSFQIDAIHPDRSQEVTNLVYPVARDTFHLNCDDLPQDWAFQLNRLFTDQPEGRMVTKKASSANPIETVAIHSPRFFSLTEIHYKSSAFQKRWFQQTDDKDINKAYGLTWDCN